MSEQNGSLDDGPLSTHLGPELRDLMERLRAGTLGEDELRKTLLPAVAEVMRDFISASLMEFVYLPEEDAERDPNDGRIVWFELDDVEVSTGEPDTDDAVLIFGQPIRQLGEPVTIELEETPIE